VKKLWERALANRTYWDRYQLAQEGLILNAKVEAQRAHKRAYRKARRAAGLSETSEKRTAYKEEQRERDDARLRGLRTSGFAVGSAVVTPIEAHAVALCIKCRGGLERRVGTINLVHIGPSCRMGFHIVQTSFSQVRCTYPTQRLGKVRPCGRFVVTGGVQCALHRNKANPPANLTTALGRSTDESGAILPTHHGQPQEAAQRPTDRSTEEPSSDAR